MAKDDARNEKALFERVERQFPTEVAIVLLVSLVVVELASISGLVQGVTSNFPQPMNNVFASLVLTISLLGAHGLFRNSRVGVHFALLASVFWMVLSLFSLVKTYSMSQWSLAQVTPAMAGMVLGSLILFCIFKVSGQQSEINPMSNTSPSSDFNNLSSTSDRYAVETIDVTKQYFLGPHVVSAVRNLRMRVRKGEFIAIMGPSGSGKSTLLNLIGALDKPSSGQVLVDGVDISTLSEKGLARLRKEKIGFVFQAYNLIARSTVLRNMELPAFVKGYSKKERMDRIKYLLDVVGLSDKLLRKPKTLSGGEQQRVAIARALVNNPEILLADEPTGNVDSKQGQLIMGFLRKLNLIEKTTVIVVTHDSEVANMADKIVYIRDGKIVREEIIGVKPS